MKKKKYKHFSLDKRYKLKEYLISETFKKKNGTPNYSKIAKVMNKSPNTIRLELKDLVNNMILKKQMMIIKIKEKNL